MELPRKFLEMFIDKDCAVTLIVDAYEITGKIVDVEDNWIMLKDERTIRIINGETIRDIRTLPKAVTTDRRVYRDNKTTLL